MEWTVADLEAAFDLRRLRGTNSECVGSIRALQNCANDKFTLFGRWHRDVRMGRTHDSSSFWYAVFSYGGHYPLAVYVPSADLWFTNLNARRVPSFEVANIYDGRVGPTTADHQNLVRQALAGLEQQEYGLSNLRAMIAAGPVGFVNAITECAA